MQSTADQTIQKRKKVF